MPITTYCHLPNSVLSCGFKYCSIGLIRFGILFDVSSLIRTYARKKRKGKKKTQTNVCIMTISITVFNFTTIASAYKLLSSKGHY